VIYRRLLNVPTPRDRRNRHRGTQLNRFVRERPKINKPATNKNKNQHKTILVETLPTSILWQFY
jgi:hypothetical protein